MEKKVFGLISILMVILTAGVTSFFMLVPSFHQYALAQSGQTTDRSSVMDLLQEEPEAEEEEENYVRLELPEGVDLQNVDLSRDDVTREIALTISGVENSYFYNYSISGNVNHIQDVYYDYAGGLGTVEFIMDSIYEAELTMEDRFLYVNFIDPRDIYDYIVVIDAGHGGNDNGCEWGSVLEKDLNFQIVEKMKEIFESSGRSDVAVYYTRLDDRKLYLKQRSGMANRLRADLFLSVHINSTATGRESYINGTSVMYQVGDTTEGSKRFAQACLNHLLDDLGSLSKGLVAGDENYIIRTAEMPVALAEIGFITNQTEREKLISEEYQEMTAQALCDAIFETLETCESRRGEAFHEIEE